MDRPETPPPEALLIRRARMAQGLSPERIVERLERLRITGRGWRQIEDGARRAPDDTLAHMAYVVKLRPEHLTDADRGEAAEILREILRQQEATESSEPSSPKDLREALRQAQQGLRETERSQREADVLINRALAALGEDIKEPPAS